MDQVNYPIVIIVVIAVIILLVWIIRRNQKDEKKLEQDIIQSELKPEENNDKEIEPWAGQGMAKPLHTTLRQA